MQQQRDNQSHKINSKNSYGKVIDIGMWNGMWYVGSRSVVDGHLIDIWQVCDWHMTDMWCTYDRWMSDGTDKWLTIFSKYEEVTSKGEPVKFERIKNFMAKSQNWDDSQKSIKKLKKRLSPESRVLVEVPKITKCAW